MHRPHPRFRLLVGAALALALAGACTEDADGTDAFERLVASAEATRDAGTARLAQHLVMEFPEGSPGGAAPAVSGGSVTVDADGFLDLGGQRGRLSLTTKGTGLAGADALGGDTDMILDGRSMYVSSPFYQQLAPDHEPWLRVSYEELQQRGMSQFGQQDPLAFVEALRGVREDVEEVGDEEVRGEPTTHYRATIDVDRLLSELPPDERATVEASFGRLGVTEMPIDVWLDDEGRLRRLVSDVALEGESVAGGRMELDLELYDYGVAFDIKIPPDDQVAEFGDVFGEPGG